MYTWQTKPQQKINVHAHTCTHSLSLSLSLSFSVLSHLSVTLSALNESKLIKSLKREVIAFSLPACLSHCLFLCLPACLCVCLSACLCVCRLTVPLPLAFSPRSSCPPLSISMVSKAVPNSVGLPEAARGSEHPISTEDQGQLVPPPN